MGSSGVKNETPAPASAAADPAPAAPESRRRDSTDKGSTEEAFHKAVGGIPVVGATLVFVVKKWGLPGLLLFFSGGVFALGLVYFGVLPERIVSDKYRSTAAAPDAQKGIALKGSIPLEIVGAESGWLQALVDLYRREGIDAQEAEPGKHSSVDAVEHTIQDTTEPFAWALSTQSNFEATAMAFKVTRDTATGVELVEQLRPGGDARSLEFSVPACRKGDRLIAVVRVWSKIAPPPEDVRFALRSGVK